MLRKPSIYKLLLPGVLLLTSLISHAQAPGDITAAAKAFLQTLDATAKDQTVFAYDDAERVNWHFVPKARKGLPLKAMNSQQKTAALRLLQTCMSVQGYQKATSIIALENILKVLEGRGADDDYRDPGKYFISIFGTPDPKKLWGWRIEGHHVALNFSSVNNSLVAGTPAFLGSNPGIVPSGAEKGKQILKQEAMLGFELLNSLDKSQQEEAIIQTDAPGDIITGNRRKAMLLDPPGLPFSKMNPRQQQLLKQLVGVYIDNYTKLYADVLLKEITAAGWDKMHFAWAGVHAWGGGHYYRIQNPAILIEYDNTQNNGNHVHTVLRDLKNDFGDALEEHYQAAHLH
jgi:Protein of unknown function (DUF3500)